MLTDEEHFKSSAVTVNHNKMKIVAIDKFSFIRNMSEVRASKDNSVTSVACEKINRGLHSLKYFLVACSKKIMLNERNQVRVTA